MQSIFETFIGRLGREPELKYTKKLEPVCTLSVAVIQGKDQKTLWKKVIVWGKQAELCTLYLKKGKEIFVQGETNKREFKGDKGELKNYIETRAKLIGFTNL